MTYQPYGKDDLIEAIRKLLDVPMGESIYPKEFGCELKSLMTDVRQPAGNGQLALDMIQKASVAMRRWPHPTNPQFLEPGRDRYTEIETMKVVKDGDGYMVYHSLTIVDKPKCWIEGMSYQFRDRIVHRYRIPANRDSIRS